MNQRISRSYYFIPSLLEKLLKERGLQKQEFAEKLGITKESFSRMFKKQKMDKSIYIAVCDALEINTLYLRGLSDNPSRDPSSEPWDRIKALLNNEDNDEVLITDDEKIVSYYYDFVQHLIPLKTAMPLLSTHTDNIYNAEDLSMYFEFVAVMGLKIRRLAEEELNKLKNGDYSYKNYLPSIYNESVKP